jgi:hypothetical protein
MHPSYIKDASEMLHTSVEDASLKYDKMIKAIIKKIVLVKKMIIFNIGFIGILWEMLVYDMIEGIISWYLGTTLLHYCYIVNNMSSLYDY